MTGAFGNWLSPVRPIASAVVNLIRFLLAVSLLSFSACSLFGKKDKNGTARMYEGDTSPVIRMSGDEGPGSPIGR